jgi:hypothetical protein
MGVAVKMIVTCFSYFPEVDMHVSTIWSYLQRGIVLVVVLAMAGCAGGALSPREKSTLGGAALGAGAGALIGEAAGGHPGKGALIGGALGGLGGALTGGALQSQDTALAQQQRELEQQQYELDRQRRELEEMRRRNLDDDYYRRDPYYDSYYDRARDY